MAYQPGEEAFVLKLLYEDPTLARISPDGERLYTLVDDQVLCLKGPNWADMTEDQINDYLEQAQAQYQRREEAQQNKDSQ